MTPAVASICCIGADPVTLRSTSTVTSLLRINGGVVSIKTEPPERKLAPCRTKRKPLA